MHSFVERCIKAKQQPFLTEEPLDGKPPCDRTNFRHPLLRRCPLKGPIEYERVLGAGLDGVVWKVRIGGDVYALKAFWDNKPPPDLRHYSIQIECHNMALLQMIESAVQDSEGPIYLKPNPITLEEAVANLDAFSEQGRVEQRFKDVPGAVPITSVPTMRECFGWTKVSSTEISYLPRWLQPPECRVDGLYRAMEDDQDYFAIVYEYFPQRSRPPMDFGTTQQVLDFLWLVGFSFSPLKRDNWVGPGILLDMADIVSPWHEGWYPVVGRWVADTLIDDDDPSAKKVSSLPLPTRTILQAQREKEKEKEKEKKKRKRRKARSRH